MHVNIIRQNNREIEHWLEHRQCGVFFAAKTVACPRKAESRNGADRTRGGFVHGGELLARIDTNLIHLLAALVVIALYNLSDPESAACDFHKGQAVTRGILGDFKHARGEISAVTGHLGIFAQAVEKLLHAVQSECGTEKTRKNLALFYRFNNI